MDAREWIRAWKDAIKVEQLYTLLIKRDRVRDDWLREVMRELERLETQLK